MDITLTEDEIEVITRMLSAIAYGGSDGRFDALRVLESFQERTGQTTVGSDDSL